MKLLRLHLQAFGPFTDRMLEFAPAGQSLTLVYGPNEAGKSATLRAISDLRFGIPAQSRDNFIHAHPDLRIGGSFIDRDGATFSILRRKGRGSTLTLLDGTADCPVPAKIEAMLTCGLSKQDHDAMFGLDHGRLREGGEALLNGEGEVGAALFEASAGARSIPAILERLDHSARRYFMPGARGKHALINAALREHAEQLAAYKDALIRPAHWVELSRKHQDTAQDLEQLEQQRRALHARVLEVRELRAVAPLLRALDQAAATLLELEYVLLLAPEAPLERASAEAGLADATHNAGIAAADVLRRQAVLDTLASDDAVLEIGALIDRLAVAAESVALHEKDLAQASADAAELSERVTRCAVQIDAGADLATVLARIPTPAARAGIEVLLQAVVDGVQALTQQRDPAARQASEATEIVPAPLASAEARIALRSATTELARSDAVLQQVVAMPAAVKAARRAADLLLTETGLAGHDAMYRARIVLDGEIDAAIHALANSSTRELGLNQRIDAIGTALRVESAERTRLLADGVVPTRGDVAAARERRELGWQQLRGVFIDMTAVPAIDAACTASLPQAFEQAVQHADAVIDALARDTERAAQLQACLQKIDTLEADRQVLQQALATLAASDLQQQQAWTRKLADAGLPLLAPAA
ncbi:MAG: AAA family ATPase, partial [Herminiimonas sp.]|nr:AAA family ATPase [Herminiimonas sp.]